MRAKHLVTVAVVLLLSAPASAQSVKAGIEAWQRADYGSAVAIWRPLAEKGDADAEFNLGQAYRLGRGVPINLGMAKSWFEKAANAGHLDAETTLGLLLFQNGDQVAGLKWLRRAAEEGEPRALLVYGTALYNGDGVTQDRLLGYAYVSRAADQGLAPAKDTLAQLDQLLPATDRAKAIALAHSIPSGSPVAPKPAKPVRVAQAKPAPKEPTAKAAKPKAADPLAPKSVPKPPAPKSLSSKPKAVPAPVQINPSGPGGWRVQLGAFSQRNSAEALFRTLSNMFPGRQPSYVAAGSVTRLQVGPYPSRAVAAKMCSIVISTGHACFPVPAK
jgi:cell division septation protein DedD